MKTEQEIMARIAELEDRLESNIAWDLTSSYVMDDDIKIKIEALKWVLGEK